MQAVSLSAGQQQVSESGRLVRLPRASGATQIGVRTHRVPRRTVLLPEVEYDFRLDLDGIAIQPIRLVAPLLGGIDSGCD
jgi:hypothetical protein